MTTIGAEAETFERFTGIRELRDMTSDQLLTFLMNKARCPSLEDVRQSLEAIKQIKKERTQPVGAV